MLPQYRDNMALVGIFDLAIKLATQHDCQYFLGVSPPSVARRFKMTFEQFGYRYELRDEIVVPTGPENSHLKLLFQISNLKENL